MPIAERMSTRYLGENGPKYLEPTLDKPRWLFRLDPVKVQTWQGVDWAARTSDEHAGSGRPRYSQGAGTHPQSQPSRRRARHRGTRAGLASELHLPRARTITRHESRPNLLITLDFGPGGRHLVLSGHLDTKPVADATWTVDPFGADIKETDCTALALRT